MTRIALRPSLVRAETPPKKATALAPREHGFWVILSVVVLSALSRTAGCRAAWLVAVPVAVVAIAFASVFGRHIRRSAGLQLVATGMLSLAGIPVELAGGLSEANAASDACAWLAVFTAFALGVRACFARASRRQRKEATALALASIVVPLATSGFFAETSSQARALALLVTGAATAGVALFRPTSKHLKSVGIALSTVAVVAAVIIRTS